MRARCLWIAIFAYSFFSASNLHAILENRTRQPICLSTIAGASRVRVVKADGSELPADYTPKHTGSLSQLTLLLQAAGVVPERAKRLVARLQTIADFNASSLVLEPFDAIPSPPKGIELLTQTIRNTSSFQRAQRMAKQLLTNEGNHRFAVSVLDAEYTLSDRGAESYVGVVTAPQNYELIDFDLNLREGPHAGLSPSGPTEGLKNRVFTAFIRIPPENEAAEQLWALEVFESVASYSYLRFISSFIAANRTLVHRGQVSKTHSAFVNVRVNRGVIQIHREWFKLLEIAHLYDSMRHAEAALVGIPMIDNYLVLLDVATKLLRLQLRSETLAQIPTINDSLFLYVQARIASMESMVTKANGRK